MGFRRILEVVPIALLLLMGSCHDVPTDLGGPGPAGGIALSLDASAPANQESPGLASAFDRVDRARVLVTQGETVVLDTTFALTPESTETELRIPVKLGEQAQEFLVRVEFLQGADRLFAGTSIVSLRSGATTPVSIHLDPVPGAVAVPDSLPALTFAGDSLRLGGAVIFATGDTVPDLALTWTAADSSVVRVGANGFAVAIAEGDAMLTGSFGGFSDSVRVQVRFAVDSIAIAPIMVPRLVPDSTVQLTATALDAQGTPLSRPIVWSVGDTLVATIDSTGLLRGRNPGSTTAIAASGAVRAEIPVSVQARAVSFLAITPDPAHVIRGDSLALTATAHAADESALTGRTIAWSSANTAIATVNARGVVQGRRLGSTQIRALVEGIRDSVPLDVVSPPVLTDSIDFDSVTVSGAVLRGTSTAGNAATTLSLRWGTSASALATLSTTVRLAADTLTHDFRFALADLAPGTVYYYQVVAGNAFGRDSLAVRSFRTARLPIASISIAPDSADLAIGDSLPFSAIVYGPGDEVLTDRSVSWLSTDTAVATVDTVGKVHGRSTGRVIVRANSGARVDSAVIHVMPRPVLSGISATVSDSLDVRVSGLLNVFGSLWVRWGTSPSVLSDSSTSIAAVDADEGIMFFIPLEGLAGGTTYHYRVFAANSVGRDSTAILSFTTPEVPPPPPSALLALPNGSEIHLTWQSAGPTATSYRLERSTDGSAIWDSLATLPPDTLRFVDGWDGSGTHNYGYRVSACGSAGCSAPTDSVLAPLDGFFRAASASVGEAHTCAIQTLSGTLYCWGANESGQIEIDLGTPVDHPVEVVSGTRFIQIEAEQSHTCGLSDDHRVFCWGVTGASEGEFGGLYEVPGGIRFDTISVGSDHACGLTTANQAYCWGYNLFSQLGTGDTNASDTPQPVLGGLVFRSISVGDSHSCALTSAGQAYCWGANDQGQLGIGTSEPSRSTPTAIVGLTFTSISAGARHTCGVAADTRIYCWGQNSGGQLGSASPNSVFAPAPIAGGLAFRSVAAGREYTCGLTPTNRAYCWGANEVGALGNGTNASSSIPTEVDGSRTFTSLLVNSEHTCGIQTDTRLFCWGADFSGQLGDGGIYDSYVPVQVMLAVPSYLPGS